MTLIFIAIAALFFGCGTTESGTDTVHFNKEEILIYGATLPFEHLNPIINEWNEASALIVSRLFTINLTAEIEGDLVESYEASPAFMSYTLKLRSGVLWHDGQPFTSEDVLFTFRELMKPTTKSVYRPLLSVVKTIEAPDAETVVIRLNQPVPAFTATLTEIGILPKHLYEDEDINDNDIFDSNPVGTGPFKLVKRRKNELTYDANRLYYHGSPLLKRIILKHIPDDDKRAEELTSGNIEVAQVKPHHVAKLSENSSLKVYRYATGVWRGFMLNIKQPILQDRRVRRAISLALDRDAMVTKGLNGMGQAANSPIPPTNWAYPQDLPAPKQDLERAKQLLDEAGWKVGPGGKREKDGVKLELTIAPLKFEIFRRTASEVAKENLEALGIIVNMKPLDFDGYAKYSENMGTEVDAMVVGWSGLINPYNNLSKKYMTGGIQNSMGYSNGVLDDILAKAGSEKNREAAKKLYRQALKIIEEDSIMPPLVYSDYVFAAKNNVTGFDGEYILDNFYEFTRFAYMFGQKK